MKYILDNLLDTAAVITPSTEDAAFPVENLYDKRPGKPFKFTTTSGNIVIDLGSAQSVSAIALINHSIPAGASAYIEGHTSDEWSDPDVSEEIVVTAVNTHKTFTAASKRYWRLVVDCSTVTAKIGELILGNAVDLSQNYNWEWPDGHHWLNVNAATEFSQRWSYHRTKTRSYSLSFAVNDTTKDEILTLLNATNGGAIPFVFINNDDEAVYVTADDNLDVTRVLLNRNQTELVLTELPIGKVL